MNWRATTVVGLTCGVLLIGFMTTQNGLGAEQTWVGMISDSTCGADHGGEVDVKECTAKCIRNGDKYVLALSNSTKVLPILNQGFPGLAAHPGDTVKVTGELKDGAIDISRIENQ